MVAKREINEPVKESGHAESYGELVEKDDRPLVKSSDILGAKMIFNGFVKTIKDSKPLYIVDVEYAEDEGVHFTWLSSSGSVYRSLSLNAEANNFPFYGTLEERPSKTPGRTYHVIV